MRGILRVIAKTLLVLAFIAGAASSVFAQTSNKTSVTLHLSVYVPPVLQLSVDFASGGVTQLTGHIGNTPGTYNNGFELRPNSIFTLGAARIVSNLNSSYSIVIQSMNNGKLKNQTSGSEIAYDLLIGGIPAARYGDAFRVVSSIKTSRDGTELPVSIALGNIPSSASAGLYTDNLLFNVMAN
ncbi:MAG: hypothetical protein SAMD01599839_06030 [Rectinema sp.]